MSSELLRRAAALMRERATDASPGQWKVLHGAVYQHPANGWPVAKALPRHMETAANNEHIASWHPGVALAVADWLETTERDVGTSSLAYHAAIAFARSYLGEPS